MNRHSFIVIFLVFISSNILTMQPDERLIKAIEDNDFSNVQLSLRIGADLNCHTNKYNVPPLVLACSKHTNPDSKIIKLLLRKGALVNGTGTSGSTALHWASTNRAARIVLSYKANCNAKDIRGNTPLHKAVLFNLFSRVKLLLTYGARPLIKNNRHKTTFNILEDQSTDSENLTYEEQAKLVKIYNLLFNSLNLNDVLIKAIQDNDIYRVAKSLSSGADKNSSDNTYNIPPLLVAVQTATHSDIAIVKLLLRAGANPNSQDRNGNTCLHLTYDKDMVLLLLDNDADSTIKNNHGQSPLHFNCNGDTISAQEDVVQLLLLKHTPVNDQDNEGNTPLHLANDPAIVSLLLEYGAGIHIQNNQGNTPLHRALDEGATEKVEKLLKASSNIFMENKTGLSSLDKASGILQQEDYKDPYYKKILLTITERSKTATKPALQSSSL
ncbi:ankyrin repeat domain-containing protein [Candidatus Dependentiae bacterium]|nr:ankyrin repeat domain-containing protein [Candidatus Dependentiae bacterium]